MVEQTPPTYNTTNFNCPYCGAFSSQGWAIEVRPMFVYGDGQAKGIISPALALSRCQSCSNVAYWHNKKLVYPVFSAAPLASPDMPETVSEVYDEARSVFPVSPRASAALVRLAIQHLCIALGEPGERIFDDIGALVGKGCDIRVQQALDIIRHFANEQVHPGTINLNEDPASALLLFQLTNMVIHDMITRPNTLSEAYNSIPETVRQAIEKRDKKATESH